MLQVSDFRSSLHRVTYSIFLSAFASLLDILKWILSDLPKDPRTVLGTKNYGVLCQASFWRVLLLLWNKGEYREFTALCDGDILGPIMLDLNVDGVPLFKSAGGHFWPVLGRVQKPFISDPYVIALLWRT